MGWRATSPTPNAGYREMSFMPRARSPDRLLRCAGLGLLRRVAHRVHLAPSTRTLCVQRAPHLQDRTSQKDVPRDVRETNG
jgi:hypothetical protein